MTKPYQQANNNNTNMARPAVALLALLAAVCVLGADARFAPSESSTGRSLLQTVDCSRIPNW